MWNPSSQKYVSAVYSWLVMKRKIEINLIDFRDYNIKIIIIKIIKYRYHYEYDLFISRIALLLLLLLLLSSINFRVTLLS